MALYLTSDDLAQFLRSRKPTDCKIAGDWVDEHQNDTAVQTEVDWLEATVLCLIHDLEDSGFVDNWLSSPPPSLLVTACLSRIATRYQPDGSTSPEWWNRLTEVIQRHFSRRSPAWAAVISRRLRLAANPATRRP